ncbi:hypothetical protein VB834_15275 [Limnoraphis robusta Tam1]|uniref:Uncharacterized protein n=1 Tax=Limnoraphis robusta CCNP1315 TaxID=3110306 RepID=A0ABU5U643_9CYAN|nr:hypothetical protein [Limnoraphis robusta]MEA5498362.1 hypothetical protein [Limnoraphis robusta BA-68 BA1]MEA5521608.1 hypothetical protein [Limnoraphis robusta CCNP1315]MEA5540386.1 hypothetical protein [Limnoraphis robusta Tam1]
MPKFSSNSSKIQALTDTFGGTGKPENCDRKQEGTFRNANIRVLRG